MNKARIFIGRHGLLILVCLSLVISVAALLYFYGHDQILAYNDARARLNIARRVSDSQTPGLLQIGTIWLPLQQTLMVPFAAVDALWRSGLAGSIVSMAAFVVASLFIFKTVLLLAKKSWLAWVGTLLFMLNVNILYLQTTAMTEILMLATTIGGIYYLLKWLHTKYVLDLVLAGVWVMLSTLVRYEGWFVLLACVVIIGAELLFVARDRIRAEGSIILFGTMALFGIALWLLWNLVFWGNALYFIEGQYEPTAGRSAAQNDLVGSIVTVWKASGFNVGFALLFAVVAAIVLLVLFTRTNRRIWIYASALLLAPVLFNIVSVYIGTSSIGFDATQDYPFNVRYGLPIVLAAAVLIPVAIGRFSRNLRPFLSAGALALCLLVPLSAYWGAVRTGRSMSPSSQHFAASFKKMYQGGLILSTSSAAFSPAQHAMGIPMKHYTSEGNYKMWEPALRNPYAEGIRYIFMSSALKDPVFQAYTKHKKLYEQHYHLVYNNQGYQVWQQGATTKAATTNSNRAARLTPVVTVVRAGDSQTHIVRDHIRNLDPNRSLRPAQVVYVETVYINMVGRTELLYPGAGITIDRQRLRELIGLSMQLDASQLAGWERSARTIVY